MALRERLKALTEQHHAATATTCCTIGSGTLAGPSTSSTPYRLYREGPDGEEAAQPVPKRQPSLRPEQPNQVWSMGFVFDELANGRRMKTLTIVDDCSKESIRLVTDTSIPSAYAARTLDAIKTKRGLSKTICTDNAEFACRTMCRTGRPEVG